MKYALVGRKGAYPERYAKAKARGMYARGVALSASDMLQVWNALDNGDLLSYNGAATRNLSDKIVAARRMAAS